MIDIGHLVQKKALAQLDLLARRGARDLARQNGRIDISCHEGCTFCCYVKIVISPIEGEYIYNWLKKSGMWSEELKQRLLDEDRFLTNTSHFDVMRQKHPCVFLKDDSCSIYRARPLGCRLTFSFKEPSLCGIAGASHSFSAIPHEPLDVLIPLRMKREHEMGVLEQVCTMPGAIVWASCKAEGLPPPSILMVQTKHGGLYETAAAFDRCASSRG